MAEKGGVRSVSIAATAFLRQAQAIAKSLGAQNLAIAEYPGVIMTDNEEQLRRKVEGVLIDSIIEGLTKPVEDAVKPVEPRPRDIVFRGTLQEVQEYFYENLWTDGLPIIPPTVDMVEKFLSFTDRSPDEVLGVLLPENREATILNVAVNGVLAGCRPEYMPLLVAAVESIADPEFGIEHAGSTPGWEPLIILNGPVIKQLDFNCAAGVTRVGRQANTSVGRFLRLYMRNVAGLRIPPGATDKATYGYTFNVVLAENEDAVTEMGWQPFSVDRGFKAGENVITVQSVISMSPPINSGGDTPLDHLETIAEFIGRRSMAYKTAPAAHYGRFHPLFVFSPNVASVIANGGWTKDNVRQYLYDNAQESAGVLEKLAWGGGPTVFNFCKCVEEGRLSRDFCQSTDPNRMVPVFLRPEWINIVVSGDPGRNQSKGFVQNHQQGPPVSRRIVLPDRWEELLRSGGK
ncbi:MAG: hypothetical protein HYX92_21145 [Chloroflexi bacterium]|nr:hypothetical protein [Chloroflexota bacterium]